MHVVGHTADNAGRTTQFIQTGFQMHEYRIPKVRQHQRLLILRTP